MAVYQLENRVPQIHTEAYVAPSADVIGSVTLGAQSSIWFNAVARGDNDPISVGWRSNVQDNTVLHSDPGIPLVIGDEVTVGHSVILHGCTIGNGCLIGIGSVVLNNASIGANSIVGANTLITENKQFPERSMIVGSPGRVVRSLTDDEVARLSGIAEIYVRKIERYRTLQQLT
jgi:carbonic anhydrase/acetyltransferase-like protein (isoleucine patch superfamily)